MTLTVKAALRAAIWAFALFVLAQFISGLWAALIFGGLIAVLAVDVANVLRDEDWQATGWAVRWDYFTSPDLWRDVQIFLAGALMGFAIYARQELGWLG